MKATILLGAGAVISWKAPKTQELTDLIKNDRTVLSKSGTPFGEVLYSILENYYGSGDGINFEIIINSIETV